jgi:RING finger protein 121/175
MWVIPLGLSLKNQWWRFIFTWLLFSCITGLVVRKAMQKPVEGTTPRFAQKFSFLVSNSYKFLLFRLVYKWFYFIYKASYFFGILGYAVMMLAFFGFNLLFGAKPSTWMDFGLLNLFYGLYYGVLGRDMAEICADKMAAHIGVRTIEIM